MKYYTLKSKDDLKGKYGEIATGYILEKKSKFYSYVFNVSSSKEAEEKVDIIRKENLDARHVVYIYSIYNSGNVNIRFSDDSEPQGTGTKAIYELLEKEKMTNICIVIVRYFGGILLGAGPLSRAYLNTARQAIDMCSKEEIFNYEELNFKLTYNGYNILKNRIENLCTERLVIVDKCDFSDIVELELKVVDFKIDEIKQMVKEIEYGA